MPVKSTLTANRIALKIALSYAFFGLCWILFSDRLLAMLVSDPQLLTEIQSIKGAAYVLVTALLVFLLATRSLRNKLLIDEQRLQAQDLYCELVERTDDFVTQVNAQGQFTFVNGRSRDIFELEPEACIGLSAFDFVYPDDRIRTIEQFQSALEQRLESVEFENRQQSRSGKLTRMLWMTNIHYHPNGKVESINGIAHDITRRKQITDTLLQTEKMVSLGGLTAGIAHEINNPLAGILQSAQLLQNRFDPEKFKTTQALQESGLSAAAWNTFLERQKVAQLLKNIRESGLRVARIVADLLDFSSNRELRAHCVDIRALLEQTVELASKEFDLSTRFDFRSITIVRDYPDDPPSLLCDRTQMQQTFLNLLQNGAHAMLTNPQVDRQPMFFLRMRTVDDWLEIEIEDNGAGMDEATCRRIFEPFFTTKEVGQGTGLGLFVAYFIITEKHAGKLQVRSKPGSGTCFTINLPLGEISC